MRSALTPADGLVGRQRALLAQVRALVAERHRLETVEDPDFAERRSALAKDFQQRDAVLAYDGARAAEALAGQQYGAQEAEIARCAAARDRTQREHAAAVAAAEKQGQRAAKLAEDRARDAKWSAQTVHDGDRDRARRSFEERCEDSVQLRDRAKQVWESAYRWLQDAGRQKLLLDQTPAALLKPDPAAQPVAPEDGPAPTLDQVRVALARAEGELTALKSLAMPNWAKPEILMWPAVLLAAAVAYPAIKALGLGLGLAVALGGAAALGAMAIVVLVGRGSAACRRHVVPLAAAWSESESARQRHLAAATGEHKNLLASVKYKLDAELAEAEQERLAAGAAAVAGKQAALADAAAKFPAALKEFDAAHAATLARMAAEHPRVRQERAAEHAAALQALRDDRDRQLADLDSQRRARWKDVGTRWLSGIKEAQSEAEAIAKECHGYAPPWEDAAWKNWDAPADAPTAAAFGGGRISLADFPNGVPKHPHLTAASLSAPWPALVHFPRESLFLRATGLKLNDANDAVQALMLRLLASLPPGKLRFTIIDPVGLGQPFASFMHLADYEDRLVHGRIWTEPRQIEQALADITGHMETVIQKYLRNEYDTIESYNAQAGEMAEPYRVVVAANFPVNFSEDAVKRLNSIVQSGARCGVQAVVTYDPKAPTNTEINVADLERRCATLQWTAGKDKDAAPRWAWRDPEFAPFAPVLSKPPEADFVARVVHGIGRKAKDALRVQVPFAAVAPPDGQWWQGDSAASVAVGLGRAGATKLQYLRLGVGTAQHVLVAGRTGSGKSTLLHALITNLALTYSPEEVELYLIDFKKGVEFKTYATHRLPHARVVAVESEREFGLSVMQRLDGELKRRGELYRQLGVQDLAGYRALRKKDPALETLPRTLLIVDEFQEFFVEDDKVAQEAALLLDRIVRQGRAFGVHAHLGSQTLGGAYSIPRATIGQMAIRIALQCSEADARMILAEDNAAARLLSRPGEAIYNDGNGAVEANSPFQVVWLGDEQRERYLSKLHELAAARNMLPKTPMIVFEGNAPADIARSGIAEMLAATPQPKPLAATLGDPVAIKDATAVEFRKQSGANLLVLGQQPELSFGIVAAAVLSLGARLRASAPPAGLPRFTLLNGVPEDGAARRGIDLLAAKLPHARAFGLRDADAAVNAAASEVERRLANPDGDHPPAFVVALDLPRFRQLRKPDDDFGFRRDPDAPPDPAKRFLAIVRDGPAVGVHVIAWCDTLNNVNRHFDRATLREFDLRALFQMSAADSGTIIDSPVASKLGANRALFLSEEQGRSEKFRPYGLPPLAWLAATLDELAARTAGPA